jgi:2-hydroxycyclohexanecarboxyl-CoA dehydrogenase
MDTSLKGKIVIVTGATANIGRAIALDFASEGAVIIAVGRDDAAGARLVTLAKERGAADTRFVAADMLNPESPARILAEAQAIGPVDILINNVGGNVGSGFFADSDPATWAGDIDLNLGTVLRMTHAVLPSMIARKSGAIVNIGSTAGIVGDYMLPVYSATKAAVHGFTKVLAKEVGKHNIRVNCVAPYGTRPRSLQHRQPLQPRQRFFRQSGGRCQRRRYGKTLAPNSGRSSRGDARRGVVTRRLSGIGQGWLHHWPGLSGRWREFALANEDSLHFCLPNTE